MVDFSKYLGRSRRLGEIIPEDHDADTPPGVALLGVDPRSAAEVMRDVVDPIGGSHYGPITEYYLEGATRAMVILHSDSAGPAARQIFSAAVMREQVDPV